MSDFFIPMGVTFCILILVIAFWFIFEVVADWIFRLMWNNHFWVLKRMNRIELNNLIRNAEKELQLRNARG